MKFSNVRQRLRQIGRHVRLARSPLDLPAFAALGIARGHPFDSPGALSAIGRRLFPELVLRPKGLGGLAVAVDPRDVTHMIIFDEVVLEQNYDLSQVPFQPDQIFDCGGHIGIFTVLASAYFPGVPLTVFEPNPRNLKWIHRQVAVNQLNAQVVPAAVSVRNGTATFQDSASFGGHLIGNMASADGSPPVAHTGGKYDVNLIDLPALLRERKPQRLLLKLDVEGEETRVIPALFDVLPDMSAIFFETHHGEAGWESARQQFQNHRFTVERRRSMGDFVDGLALRS